MKTTFTAVVLILSATLSLARPPATPPLPGDRHAFDVRAVAPAVPALKYHLMVDDRVPGDAAALYFQAILLIPEGSGEVVDSALDAHDAGQSLADNPKVSEVIKESKPVFDLLAVAARRTSCDWNCSVPAMMDAPRLNRMRQLANLLRMRGIQQIDTGDYEGAVASIRIEYAMGRHVADGTPLVSGLVGLGIAAIGDTLVADMMSRPDCPNLYWPLVNLPSPMIDVKEVMEGERQWLLGLMPVLEKGRSGNITAEDWPVFVHQLAGVAYATVPDEKPNDAATMAILGLTSLPKAKQFYADTRHMELDEAAKIDTGKLLAIYFIEQYQIAADEQTKVLALPLNEAILRSAKLPDRLKELRIENSNLAMTIMPALTRVPETFGQTQRTSAALTVIEALRAYAAEHAGKFPAKLDEMTEMPIPVNPMTGKAFDYRVDGDTATVSDEPVRHYPLVYTLRIQH